MTRRILLTLAATTAVVLIAFLVPLFVLVRDVAADRATNAALLVAQPLVPVVGTLAPDGIDAAANQAAAAADLPVTVYLADGTVLGSRVERTTAVDLAASGRSFVEENDDGRSVLVPVAGRPEGTAVLRVDVPTSALRSGVPLRVLALLGLALGLFAVALVVGASAQPLIPPSTRRAHLGRGPVGVRRPLRAGRAGRPTRTSHPGRHAQPAR